MAEKGTIMHDVGSTTNKFNTWLYDHGLIDKIVVAGKNYANFDLRFLEKLPGWSRIKFDHRIIDVGNLYWEPKDDGPHLPDLSKCLKRAGLNPLVSHNAIADAIQVIQLIRAKC
jgi:hypothetical protein